MDADKEGHHNGGGVDDTDEETNRGMLTTSNLHMRWLGWRMGWVWMERTQ
jgi:hypothetical protein